MGRAAVGRADLLRCLGAEGGDALPAMAGLLGYRRLPARRTTALPPRPPPDGPGPPAPGAEPAELPEASREAVHGVTFYRVVGYRPIPRELAPGQRPAWYLEARPFTAEELRPGERGAPPGTEPLVPWPRLWPFLRAVLGLWGERREPDLARLVDLVARGCAPRRLPRLRRHRWAPACQLILDLSPRLLPFHDDYRRLLPALGRLRGHIGLDVFVFPDGPDGEARRIGDPAAGGYRPPEGDVPLLILGDLGCLGESEDRAAWRRLGRRLRRAGLAPVALMPCPPRYWDPRLAGLFFPVTWDRAHRLPRRPAGPRPWPAARAEPAEDTGAARLLDLLAPAIRIEPALLRALRHALPDGALDVGAEAAAWVHLHLEPTPFALGWADQAAVQQHRDAYRGYPAADRGLAGALIRRHHAHLAQSVQSEEAANLAELDRGGLDAEAAAYLARTLRTLDEAAAGLRAPLAAWAARLGTRQHAGAWSADPRRTALWMLAHRKQLLRGACELPPGLDLASADWVLGSDDPPRVWTLYQQGQGLALAPTPNPGSVLDPLLSAGEATPGSALERLWLSDAPLQYAPLSDPERQCSVPPGGRSRIPLEGPGIVLRGYDAELTIAAMTRPDWAEAIGRDGSGLYAEVAEGQGTRRLRWVSPSEALSLEQAPWLGDLRLREGAFWDERHFFDWCRRELAQPGWAQRAAIDRYGLFAEFVCKGVTQRMRWIWPCEFWMGTPEDEPERRDDEVRHRVMLTRGYWLADTACTQALWKAVMGENPSRFKGPERPVEQVTWEDVQRFLQRLGDEVPGLDPRLPSEAEWENACRAGTETPFSFGPTIGTDQVNYDANWPYAGVEKGVYRKEPVDVKALPANDWGLYQMHGNVWEWCQDWYGAYLGDPSIDPAGTETGVVRVCRGGGWISPAVRCRSGRRDQGPPDSRYDFSQGFRLARGPSNRAAGPQPARQGQEAQGGRDAGETKRSGVGQALRAAWGKLRGK